MICRLHRDRRRRAVDQRLQPRSTKVPGPYALPWVVYGPDSTTTTLQYGTFAATRLNPLEPVHVILGRRYSWYEAEIDGEQVLN